MVKQHRPDRRVGGALQRGQGRLGRAVGQVIDDLVSREEGDDRSVWTLREDDLRVGHGRLRCRRGREAVLHRIGADDLPDDSCLTCACCPEEQHPPVAVIKAWQADGSFPERSGRLPERGVHAFEEDRDDPRVEASHSRSSRCVRPELLRAQEHIEFRDEAVRLVRVGRAQPAPDAASGSAGGVQSHGVPEDHGEPLASGVTALAGCVATTHKHLACSQRVPRTRTVHYLDQSRQAFGNTVGTQTGRAFRHAPFRAASGARHGGIHMCGLAVPR